MRRDLLTKELSNNKTRHKSASAFRTIGEVASELSLPPHVLRFWESKFTQIKPHKRRGGHRYYRPADVDTIKEIKSLLYERGYTIKGAQKHLKDIKQTAEKEDQPTLQINTAPASSSATTRLKQILTDLHEVKDCLQAAGQV